MLTRAHAAGWTAVVIGLAAGAVLGCTPRPELPPPPARDTDLVGTGYGSQRRADVATSIASVHEAEIDRQKALSVADLLERVPGLQVDRQGHEFTVRVRNATGEPLIVIDGQPLRGASYVLAALRPSDIERIDVLRDAASAAVYGVSGGSGVILVRTRLPHP